MRFFNKSPDIEAGQHNPTRSTTKKYHLPFRNPIQTETTLPPDPNNERNAFKSSSKLKDLDEFMAKYDPRSTNVPSLYPMDSHRDMMRTMHLDNILYNTARLHKHYWIMNSQNDLYRELQTYERYGQIQDDLERYTKSIQNYEHWLQCWIQSLDIPADALPANYHTYGRNMAILECATRQNIDSEKLFVQGVAEGTSVAHFEWAMAAAERRRVRQTISDKRKRRRGLRNRVAMAIFSGAAFIIPMVIMTVFNSTINTIIVAGAFTLAIGLILAFWMTNASTKDIIAATAGYAAVLVVFVGSGHDL